MITSLSKRDLVALLFVTCDFRRALFRLWWARVFSGLLYLLFPLRVFGGLGSFPAFLLTFLLDIFGGLGSYPAFLLTFPLDAFGGPVSFPAFLLTFPLGVFGGPASFPAWFIYSSSWWLWWARVFSGVVYSLFLLVSLVGQHLFRHGLFTLSLGVFGGPAAFPAWFIYSSSWWLWWARVFSGVVYSLFLYVTLVGLHLFQDGLFTLPLGVFGGLGSFPAWFIYSSSWGLCWAMVFSCIFT